MHGQGLSGMSPRVGQTILTGSGQASTGPAQNIGWGDRPENSSSHQQHVSAAHQILQSRPQQLVASLPTALAAAGVLTTRDSQYNKKVTGLHLFEKQNSSSIFPGKDTVPVDKTSVQKQALASEMKNSAFQSIRSRSPSNFLLWGSNQPTSKKTQSSNPAAISSNMGLALKMHPISDSKRQQSNVVNTGAPSRGVNHNRGQSQRSSVWAAGNTIAESGNSQQQAQQRAAGKGSGLTYVLTQAGKQQQMNFDNPRFNAENPRFKAMQTTFNSGQGREGSGYINQYNQFINTPSQNKYLSAQQWQEPGAAQASTTNSAQMNLQFGAGLTNSQNPALTSTNASDNLDQNQKAFQSLTSSGASNLVNTSQMVDSTDQFKISGSFGTSSKYRSSIEAQMPKPQVITNPGHGPAKRITNRLNKGHHMVVKQHGMQDSGLQVMGLSVATNKDQLQQTIMTNTTTSSAMMQQADQSMSEDMMIEMTPDQSNKGKYGGRVIVAAQSEATSIMKAPIHNKAQPNSVFMSSQDQTLQQHKRHADDGHSLHRRAESMGKQKLQSKFSSKADEHGSLEGLLQVKNLQQQTQETIALRGKKKRHTNSFQGGIRPLKNNAPFKPKQTNSTTTSQFNDSGHGSGGNAPNSLNVPVNANTANESSSKFGLNTTTLSQERDSHMQQMMQNSHIKNRRQIPTNSNHPVIFLHPNITNRNKLLHQEMPKLSPAPNRSKLIISFQMSEGNNNNNNTVAVSGGEHKMQQLHSQFIVENSQQSHKNQLAPTASPKSSFQQQTPISNRKKKTKLVYRDEHHSYAGQIKTERLQATSSKQGDTSVEEDIKQPHVVKESVKHRKLKNMIRQNKLVNNMNVSSFISQEKDDGQSIDSSGVIGDGIQAQSSTGQPHAQQLQQLQEQILRNKDMDSSSEDTLSRGEGLAGVADAMAIVQGYTPSGLAISASTQKNDSQGQPQSNMQQTPESFQKPKEFSLEEKDEVVMTQVKELNSNPTAQVFARQIIAGAKDQSKTQINSATEQKKMHPIFSKASQSKDRHRESENYSKHQSSSDSSFQQAFEQILIESESLKWQLEEILFHRMTPNDPIYHQFIDRVVAKNKERQQKIFFKSMPAQRRKGDIFENKFTRERIEQHIEDQKKRLSENLQRPFHSDMSRSRFFSNSVREDHPSITSPNWSGTVGRGTGLCGLQRHLHRHERKRRLHRYLSFSNGVTYHAKSDQNSNALLPELSGGDGHYRNSFCQFGQGGRPFFGVSDSLSSRVIRQYGLNSGGLIAVNNNSSNSNQTATPVQQQESKKKLEDLKDATKRVQILAPVTSVGLAQEVSQVNNKGGNHEGVVVRPDASTSKEAFMNPPNSLQMIYEKLNMNDRKNVAQFNAVLPHFQQQKQENNFFTQVAPAEVVESNKLYGKNIEWQMGKQLGNGTTGEVYEALNIDTGETFAVKMIKLMHPYLGLDQQKVKSVKKEIQRYKQLNHRHIVKYYDSEIIESNVLCIYLEYVYKSIAQMCKEYGKIGEKNARMYTQQALKALDYLHSQNVTHGDLKGANVLVSQDGKEIKLCDMGNSLQLKAPITTDLQASSRSLLSVQSLVVSSPAWMAPETHLMKVGRKSDIWSLGCLVVEMISGQNPWGTRLDGESNVHTALQQRLANLERPDIPSDVSEECQNFIDRCLQHNSSRRPNARELLTDPWIKNNKDHASLTPRH